MSTYIYPTSVRAVTDNFAAHVRRGSVNPGTDFPAVRGTKVVAIAAGRVVIADTNPNGSGGRIVSIKHADGSISDYLHLQSLSVGVNAQVTQGQQIGLTGASANGSESGVGTHLHLSLHVGPAAASLTRGGSVDFERYVNDTAAAGDANISLAQQLLNNLGYGLVVDGKNGPKTIAAVKDYQVKHGLVNDGIVGPITMGSLQANQPKPPLPAPVGGRHYTGIQKMLKKLYGYTGAIDNQFGPDSMKAFQRFLAKNWGYTGPIDGVMSSGGASWKAAQRWLAAKYGYTGAIDGIPGDGTNAAWNRADAANGTAY